jgi:hypothetical protein
MSHRNPFKPHKDHPSLDEVTDGDAARNRDVREAFQRAFTADAASRLREGVVREPESLSHG